MKKLIAIMMLLSPLAALCEGEGQLLYGHDDILLYNRLGKLIYKKGTPARGTISIWCDFKDDLDICGHFSTPSSSNCLGWDWLSSFAETLTKNGVNILNTCSWTGDVTDGGIEEITLNLTCAETNIVLTYSVNCNYFETENPVAVNFYAWDGYGGKKTVTVTPSNNEEHKAETSDPAATFSFYSDGRLIP